MSDDNRCATVTTLFYLPCRELDLERLRQRDARRTEADRNAAARVSEATQRSRERKQHKVRACRALQTPCYAE